MKWTLKHKTPPYLLGRFFDGISSGLFMLALPWMMLKMGDSGTWVALTALVCTLISFLGTPFFSAWIDRASRKSILIQMQKVQATTALLVALLYWQQIESIWILASSQLIFWVTSQIAWNTNQAFTQENYSRDEYAKIASYQEITMQSTTLGSGALGVYLLEYWGVMEFALLACIASTLANFCYRLTPYSQQIRTQDKTGIIETLKQSRLIFNQEPQFYAFLMLSCLSYPIVTFLGKLIPILFAQLQAPGHWVALHNIMFGLGSLSCGVIVWHLLRNNQEIILMKLSMLILGVILLGMGATQNPLIIISLTFAFGLFNALNRIARANLMHHVTQISQRGRINGGLNMFSTAAQSLSYFLIAVLVHLDAVHYGFSIVGVIVFIAAFGMYYLQSTYRFAISRH